MSTVKILRIVVYVCIVWIAFWVYEDGAAVMTAIIHNGEYKSHLYDGREIWYVGKDKNTLDAFSEIMRFFMHALSLPAICLVVIAFIKNQFYGKPARS